MKGAEPPFRLGVVGTLVWDTIHARDLRTHPIEEWGGIAYALEALSASLAPEWEIVPVAKVGRDLSEEAFRYLRTVPRVRLDRGVRVVPEANNRVELRYGPEGRRTERLSGGVPPWLWADLAPIVHDLDALYVNFISGFELELDTARSLREGFRGPTYADLHSLFLGVGARGVRIPQELPSWGAWLRSFDAVQMNEDEFALLGREFDDPWRLAAEVVGSDLKLVLVTMGAEGAAYVAGPGFRADPGEWWSTRRKVGVAGPSRSGKVASEPAAEEGDPTGCGDVWGATFFARLLGGEDLEEAMGTANRTASRNVGHRGARGLHQHLRGRIQE